METIELNGKPVKVTVRRGRRKTADIEFKSKEELLVTLPKNADFDVKALLRKHASLIERRYRECLQRKKILEGNKIRFKGIPYAIHIKRINKPQGERVSLENDTLKIYLMKKENPAIILKRWITYQTEQLVRKTTDAYANLEKPNQIFVQDTRRWGYCKENGDVIFNWQLSSLPEGLAKYVVVHELIHLSAMNHQKAFHRKIFNIFPDYREKEGELSRYLAIEPNFQFKTTFVY